jgi:hypothetical protein
MAPILSSLSRQVLGIHSVGDGVLSFSPHALRYHTTGGLMKKCFK